MCFCYSINKANADKLLKKGVLSNNQIAKISNKTLVNGFERPAMPVVSNLEPNNICYYQWGLVPNTVKSNIEANQFLKSYNTLNAKSENIFSSKIYSTPILTQRCLVLATGFFEWQHFKGKKYPYYITLNDNSLFAFAGIWDKWIDENGNATHTYSILTTEANELMAKIHNTKKRMPVILSTDIATDWLKEDNNPKMFSEYFKALESSDLKAHTIKPISLSKQYDENDLDLFQPFNYSELNKGNNSKEGNQLTIGW